MNYVLIGDIHSQARQLESALSFIQNNISNARVIFLGDIFDSKNDYSDSYAVYSLIREAEQNLNAIILQSNHQDKLIRFIRGNQVHINSGLEKTINELILHVSFEDLYAWLIRQPFGMVFRDNDGVEYRSAHAYFSDEVDVPNYDEYHLVKVLQKHLKHEFLYGPYDAKRNRVHWWENHNSSQDFIRVAGHYRVVYNQNQSLILDGSCGNDDGRLHIYDVNQKEFHSF
jgi:hypothetical protein